MSTPLVAHSVPALAVQRMAALRTRLGRRMLLPRAGWLMRRTMMGLCLMRRLMAARRAMGGLILMTMAVIVPRMLRLR